MLRPDPLDSLQRSPDPIAELREALYDREGRVKEGKGGREKKGREGLPPKQKSWLRPCYYISTVKYH